MNYGIPDNRGKIEFIGKSRNIFLLFSINLIQIKVFKVADSEPGKYSFFENQENRNLTENSLNIFFFFSLKPIPIMIFDIADSEFLGFRIIRIIVFADKSLLPENTLNV